MAMKLSNLYYLLLDIPNSEAVVENQLDCIKDRDVSAYYTNDDQEYYNKIFEFFDGFNKDFVIDHIKTNEYIAKIKEEIMPFKSMFKGNLSSIKNYELLKSDVKIKPMYYTGKNNRYITFNREDEKSKEFKSILLGKVTTLVIVSEEEKFILYPVLKSNFDYYFVEKRAEQDLFFREIDSILSNYQEDNNENWIESFALDNLNLISKLWENNNSKERLIKALEKHNYNAEQIIKEILSSINIESKENHFYPTMNIEDNGKDTFDLQPINFESDLNFESLYFEDEELLKKSIKSVFLSGKNLILVGPPGTGKSKVAKLIARSYKANYKMVTAMSDWSSYDTIGGYKPNHNGELYFDSGIFLSVLKDENNLQKNQWLIIDEMNRADIDKAFGSFFSTLSGDDVDLGLKNQNRPITLSLQRSRNIDEPQDQNEYIIPNDWRLIGTINTFDKSSLYEMSYAFMRRFAFVQINVPQNIDKEIIEKYLSLWDIQMEKHEHENLSNLWNLVNRYKVMGPAIIEDIANFIIHGGDYVSAIAAYVLPQFEGLYDDQLGKFYNEICSHIFIEDKDRLKKSIETFFDIEIEF